MDPILLNLCRPGQSNQQQQQQQQQQQPQENQQQKDKQQKSQTRKRKKESGGSSNSSSSSSSSSKRSKQAKTQKEMFKINVSFQDGNLDKVEYNRIPIRNGSAAATATAAASSLDCTIKLHFHHGQLIGIDSERTCSEPATYHPPPYHQQLQRQQQQQQQMVTSDKEYFEMLSEQNEKDLIREAQRLEEEQKENKSQSSKVQQFKTEQTQRELVFQNKVNEVKRTGRHKKIRAAADYSAKLRQASSEEERSAWKEYFREHFASIDVDQLRLLRELGENFINTRTQKLKEAGLASSAV